MTDNKIGVEGAKTVGELLKVNTALATLDLSCGRERQELNENNINCKMTVNKIGVDGTKSLVEVLKTNITLTSLKMNSKRKR